VRLKNEIAEFENRRTDFGRSFLSKSAILEVVAERAALEEEHYSVCYLRMSEKSSSSFACSTGRF